MKLSVYFAVPLALMVFGSLLPAQGQQQDDTAIPTVGSTGPLSPVTEALRQNRVEEAARLLKAIDVKTLSVTDQSRYRRLSSLVALRVGDKAWLEAVVRDPAYSSNSLELLTVTAARLLQDGRFEETRAVLNVIPEPTLLSEVPRRRYLTLRAKLALFDGDAAAERGYIAKIVESTGDWSKPHCQACHANPRKFGEQVTTFDANRWWVGQRFTVLVQKDAETIVSGARKRLAANPQDEAARLRLAYALRALNKTAEATQTLRELPWVEFEDREKRPPLRFTTFP